MNRFPRRCRNGGHLIKSFADVRSSGTCSLCARENERSYRRRLIDARDRLAQIEAG